MASNSFGSIFRCTTWGESHGKGIGVVIDGCPAGIPINEEDINKALARRAPGTNPYTTPRNEKDFAEIYSGVFEGTTTGAPISIVIHNGDADSSKYEPIKNLLRPGHANYTYLQKYGVFDYRGGGRSSARETAGRVAASAIAAKMLSFEGVRVVSHLQSVGPFDASTPKSFSLIEENVKKSPIFMADPITEKKACEAILDAIDQKDSLGGIVEFIIEGAPVGLGDPVYEKLEANLAKAMMSIPATKGFEIGLGFAASRLTGSTHNDEFIPSEEGVGFNTNHAGGILGGISTGMPIIGRVAFKPTSSIMREQNTTDTKGHKATFVLPQGSRHDPCVAVRGVVVVEAMCWLTLADAWLKQKTQK